VAEEPSKKRRLPSAACPGTRVQRFQDIAFVNPMHSANINLSDWTKLKDRGALAKSGAVYRSNDGALILRTGNAELIQSEAEFSANAKRRGFPVPELVDVGILPSGQGYFIELSVGDRTFAEILSREYAEGGGVSDGSFRGLTSMATRFLLAQIEYGNRQHDSSQLRDGIELPNILAGGIIDFERRFVAPAGYDVMRCLIFHRLWDFPLPDGTGTNTLWEFSRPQTSGYLQEMDLICEQQGIPSVSSYLDGFLALNAIWALCYERTEDQCRPQFWRWQWRKRVAVHCAERYLAGKPIDTGDFRRVGFEI